MEPTAQIGAYRVTKTLATGATSCVLAAVAEGPAGFAQPVALKTLRGEAMRSREVQRDFEHEARAAATVYHPHVVQVHAFIEDRGRSVLVMELVRGWSARALVATLALTRRCVAFEIAVALVRDAARGADALHDVGMLHRNLSPDNLMISAAGYVKIIDFGAASWGGLHLDRSGDVFSLGAVLRELCSGAPPEALPAGLGAVLDRALRNTPQDRFTTAADLAEALDDVAAHHRWRTTPALIGEYLAQTFVPRPISTRLRRRLPSESGITRVRLRRRAR